MKKIENFDQVKEAGGAIENLPAGGYICTIMKCAEERNRNSNGTHLTIQFDIAEGEHKDWFAADWKNQAREDKFWHGVINQNIPDETSPKYEMQCGFFKRFTNAVEASNPGYHWDWNEVGLKGKKIGVVFGEVEKESQRGTRYMITRADSICSTDEVRNGKCKIPAPKMLEVVSRNMVGEPSYAATSESDLPF